MPASVLRCLCFVLAFSFDGGSFVAAARAQTTGSGSTTVKTITFSMTPQAAIDPLIYGVNYEWAATPQSQFPAWLSDLQGSQAAPSAPASLVRYPGGWDGEYYAWSSNTMQYGGPAYTAAGVPPSQLLNSVQPLTLQRPLSQAWYSAISNNGNTRSAAFQLPIRQVVQNAIAAQVPARILQTIARYRSIVSLCSSYVQYWELGNEWWLQNGAANDTAPLSQNPQLLINLQRYAALVAAAAPALKAQFPGIKLYVTADWTTAGQAPANDQFVQLRALVGPAAWADIAGISIHPYCGTNVAASLCTSLPAQVKTIVTETGKSDIFASEWAVVMSQNTNDYGIRNASATVSAFQDIALAGISEATYWPAIGSVPAIALANSYGLTSTGITFRTMALVYEGQALATQVSDTSGPAGQTAAVAALNDVAGTPSVGLIIPSNGDGAETIDVPLAGTGLSKVSASSVIYSEYPNSSYGAAFGGSVPLNVTMIQSAGGETAQFVLNPGTSGRGTNWEIAVLELQ